MVKATTQDWSWISTSSSLDHITPHQRRQAAGLVGQVPCPRDLEPQAAPKPAGKAKVDGTPASKGSVKAKGKGKGPPGCRPKGCKGNCVCYNHLGAEALLKHDAKEQWVEERLGEIPEERQADDPAGLRNLGATCYANAFLQLWFHDIPFRNAVYACVTSENTPLFQLALIFAMLEHSEKKVVDPMGLIDALRLNAGDQQDAAEFSKLFMSLIASEFGKNPDPNLKSLVSDQYEGKMQYITKCECEYESITETTFLELELSLKDNTTLQNRLDTFMQPEILDGDNKYDCPSCLKKRSATRRQFPSRLPPVIHFSLMRFVFDMASMNRKKSKASIRYPKEIVLGNSVYELRGVITHMGTSTDFTVPREALAGWLQAKTFDELFAPFDFSPLLCEHGQIDPTKSTELRLISALAHDKLSQYSALPPLDICPECIGVEFSKRLKGAERQAAVKVYDDFMSDLTGDDEGEMWCVPQTWVLHWRSGKLPADTTPSDPEYSLFCEHGKPSPDMPSTSNVTASALAHLRSIFGEFPAFHPSDPLCPECSHSGQADAAVIAQWKMDVKFDRAIKKHLDPKPPAYGMDYFVLPQRWVEEWERYMKAPGEKPDLNMERDGYCEHGMLDWDPEVTRSKIVDENGWDLICQKYGEQLKPIKIQYGPDVAEGKKYGIRRVSATVCEPCRSARLSTYRSVTIPVVIAPTSSTNGHENGNGNSKTANGNGKTSRTTSRSLRARHKTLGIPATPETSIKEIKIEIMNQTGIFPMLQKLFYRSRELEVGEETVRGVGYLEGEDMVLEEMDGEGEWNDDGKQAGGPEEGFGGTALLARVKCPDCTYENDGTATCCDMCGRPFIYD